MSGISKTWLARLIRKLPIRGRKATGFFSLEGNESSADDAEEVKRVDPTGKIIAQNISARRGQHYGFVSECPDNADTVVLTINGGANNRVTVAEIVPDEPEIDAAGKEVMLYCAHGQRVHLNKDGDVFIYPGTGKSVYIGDSASGNCDKVVTKAELNLVLRRIRAHTHPNVGATAGDFSAFSVEPESVLVVSGSPNVSVKKP